jgi:hypothetical protein
MMTSKTEATGYFSASHNRRSAVRAGLLDERLAEMQEVAPTRNGDLVAETRRGAGERPAK